MGKKHHNKKRKWFGRAQIRDARDQIREEEDMKRYVDNSEGIKRAETERIKAIEAMRQEVELFISNIPYNILAKDLVEFFSNKLRDLGFRELKRGAIVYCQIIEKKNAFRAHSGCATIILESVQHFDSLVAAASTLYIGTPPRLLRIKKGNGNRNKNRQIVPHRPVFNCSALQLALSVPTNALASTAVEVEWETCDSAEVSFTIVADSRKFQIEFQQKNETSTEKNVAAISLKKIRKVCIGRDSTTGDIVLYVYLRHPPNLFRKGHGKLTESSEASHLFAMPTLAGLLGLDSFAAGAKTNFVWSLLDSVLGEDPIRTTDRTCSGAFGRCLLYRLVLGPLGSSQLQEVVSELQDFALLPRATFLELGPFARAFLTADASAAHSDQMHRVWGALGGRLPFSLCFLLHCLHGANKIDLVAWLRRGELSAALQVLLGRPPSAAARLLREAFDRPAARLVASPRDLLLPAAARGQGDAGKADLQNQTQQEKEEEGEVEEEEDEGEEEEEGEDRSRTASVARALVTPLRICPQPPQLEQSNRVIRHFFAHLERFIRVTFVDENLGSIHAATSSDIFSDRLRHVMREGLHIAGRRFAFLAFSNSQIREQSCWFYDEEARTTTANGLSPQTAAPSASDIRLFVGDLSAIKGIGKYAARLGQGFSTTVAVTQFAPDQHCVVPDVVRSGFCFSDGVGMISAACARGVSDAMGLRPVPSAFQIRFGGGKGVLTVVPDDFIGSRYFDIALRQSMVKFPSQHSELEITSFSKQMPCFLNRQLISLLSTRGVPDSAFLSRLADMVQEYDGALSSSRAACELIQRFAAINHSDPAQCVWACVWRLLSAGVQVDGDLFLRGMVSSLRNYLLLNLQTKARIHLKRAVCLIGVMDETFSLRSGQVFVQLSGREPGLSPTVLRADSVLVGRSPSLHPGDLRRLSAVDAPALRHLVDVVVFPASGPRPHCDEMSGGDLDGDIYFVIWDADLIPRDDFPPMDYAGSPSAAAPLQCADQDRGVSVAEIGDFFVDYIKNDNLGQIANAHLVFADLSGSGAASSECLALAQLHSTAVDFAKSGIPAEMVPGLRATSYPTFMENRFKTSYESEKVLGKIYRIVKNEQRTDYSKTKIALDESFLVEGFDMYVEDAENVMQEYNSRLWRIMQRYGVMDEMELLSGYVLHFSRKVCPKGSKGKDDVLKRLRRDVKQLRSHFLQVFWEEFEEVHQPVPAEDERRGGDREGAGEGRRSLRAGRKASAWYYCAYRQDMYENDYLPLISFAWLLFDVLLESRSSFCKYESG